MERMEKELEDVKEITTSVDKKGPKKEKKEKKTTTEKEGNEEQIKILKFVQGREKILREEWNEKVC